MTGPNPVSIENLWVRLDDRTVLEDVTLEVKEGDFLGLIGPNGGGKTTLLKVILGLLKPSRGKVLVYGMSPETARKRVGYLPQKSLFDKNFPITALEAVIMGRYGRRGLLGRYSTEDKDAALSALEAVGMEEHADREIGALSGGQQQRIFVARALVSEPDLLLLDEPATGIDSSRQREFYELLRDMNEKMTIIMVSHDISAVSTYVKKIACVSRKLYYHGSKELTAEEIEEAYHCPVEMIAHGIPHRVLREHD
ncbi:MAG: ABC transporter ATP-binding protein [Methanothrix sp.]|jgi:zinc transport system ATP-binding protein|uniref:Cobalamin import ATP-binding protein BtuD n=1 Tax=Methanothrix harundinacea TaxID=301375 RepID=A0A101IKY5_9EURY|nr:MAG: ABC transporter [Methanosaeta sp. SDB]KUK44566.1 MAG: Cation ABC transporter, ATP-binding protein [Methanothrix harundinacea]MDD2639208.1 ABC transporter ATP-binding protein [Methanothrix sp.]MDI9398458.1 ABC transporter ATP-binding protein [Euryarchaeota archaeon]KUK97130.1 MAG: Cation ABC transporter, ATP-binding protein [Methanothrix harundinacea]